MPTSKIELALPMAILSDTKKYIQKLVLSFALLLASITGYAQAVSVSTLVLPPYSPKLSDYSEADANRVIITLTNNTQRPQSIKLHLKFTGDNGVRVATKVAYEPSTPIVLNPLEVKRLSGVDDFSFLDIDNFEISGFDAAQIAQTSIIPEGNYTICAVAYQALTPGTSVPLSDINGGCSAPIPIAYVEAPLLIGVSGQPCGSMIQYQPNNLLTFTWNPSAGARAGVKYRFTMFELLPANRVANDAIFSDPNPIVDKEVDAPFIVFSPQQTGLLPGVRYVYRVQVIDPTEQTVFKNQGYSQICTFGLAADQAAAVNNSNSNYTGEIVYPAENDTLPFQKLWIVSKLSPGVRNVSQGDAQVSLRQNQFALEEIRNAYRNINNNTDQSSFAHHPNASLANSLHGREINAAVNFNLNITGNAVQQEISLNQSYTYGMGKPAVLNANANADSALVFNLRILPSAAPSSILPKGIQTLIRDQNNPAERWTVNEKMFVEVSNNQNFTNPVRVKFIPFALSFDPANITEDEIRRNLYAAKNISIRLPNANATFVRVGWLSNATDSTAAAYHYSSAVNLAGQIAQAQPRAGVRVGGRIRIAGFDLVIAELASQQSPYTGVGKIIIPFLNQSIKINFQNLIVDSLGNVRGGFARAFNTFIDSVNSNLNREASKAMMLLEEKRREMLDLVRRNLPDTNGLSLPYTFTWGDGNRVTIYKLDFNRDSASVHAYSEIQLPFDEGEEPLKIGLFNARFTPNCIGAEQLKFDVLSTHSFALGGGNFLNVAPRGGRNSFVNFNCSGFQGAQLIGSVRISPQYIKTAQNNDTVVVNTEVTLDSHYESITNIAVPAFIVNKLNDWNFSNSNWILDLSSSANGVGMPGNVSGRRINVDWKGLYVAGLTVTTPRWVAGQNNVRPVVNARQLLIDETGFTGKIGATNLIPNDGSRNWSGWNYSIDSVGIDFRSNTVQRSTIRGRIKTPLHKNNASASFDLGVVLPEQGSATYTGQFTLGRDIEFSALYAQVDITETVAHISIGNDVNFDLQLTGSMTANVPLPGGGNEAANARIRFRDMSIRNIGNTFELRNVEFEDVRVMGYELGAEEVELTSATDRNNPQLKVYSIRIGGCLASEAVSFANMQSALRLNFEYDNNRKRFTPRSPDLDNASVSGEFGPLSLSGSLAFYNNDQTWGNGLAGRVNCWMDFGTSDGVQITSNFRLGKKNTTVYWYIDGSVGRLNIPLFPGVMNLDGFGIGVYSNLSPVKSNTPGSYYTYTVSANKFGFIASVSMSSVTPGAYKLKGEINTTFNTSNFLVYNVRLCGKLALMGSNYPGEGNGDFKFSADVELNMDLENGAFQGNASAYLKVGPLIRGSGNGDRFGTIDVSVRRGGYWHVHVGRPQDNNYAGMNIGVGALALEFRTYFMIGKDIPPMQYPQALIDIIGVENLPTPRAAPEITQGFAHGASLSFDSGKKTFLIFYGRFRFTVGYDFNVLKYENASCDGINTRTIGIDNWYAQGQVYAGARGSIGMHVDVWFFEGNIEIASISGAVLLEVGLPNPTWIAGRFAGRYRVLAGAIKGSYNFKFSFGNVCRPTVEMESPVANLELIEAIDPDNPRAVQKPDVVPEVAMRFVRANAFTIAVPDAEGSGSVIRTFRANWDINFNNVAQNGQKISVAYRQDVSVSEDSFSYIKLIPNGFLPFDKSYEVSVTARMEERINGRWVTARRKDNSLITQTKTIRFRTTPLPTIEPYYISNQYPEPNRSYMYNYTSNGRMVFVDNPSGLFMPTASKMKSQLSGQVFDFGMEKNVKYLIRYTDIAADQQAYVPLNIPPRTLRVDFNLRPLGFGKTYKIEIIRVLRENTFLNDYQSSMDRPIFHAATSIMAAASASIGNQVPSNIRQNVIIENSFDVNGNTIEVVRHRRQSNMSLEEFLSAILVGMVNSFEDVMYETYVMTSKYQSLREKFERTNFGFLVLGNSINLLGTGEEGLSVEDMDGRLAWWQEGLGGHPIWAIPTENNAWFVKAKQFYEALTVLFNENMLLQQDIQQYGKFSTNSLYSSSPAPRGSYVFTPGDLHIKLFPINNNSVIGYNNDVRSWMGSRNLYTSMALSGNKFQLAPHQVLKRDWERARNWISVMASSNRIPQNASNNARSKAIWILFNEAPDLQEGGGSNNWRLSVFPKERVMREIFPELPPIGNFILAPSIR
jgi:hypothetical protein